MLISSIIEFSKKRIVELEFGKEGTDLRQTRRDCMQILTRKFILYGKDQLLLTSQ